MIRRLKSDVLAQLPAKQRQMIILDPAAVKSRTKEMETQAAKMGQKSLSSGERRGVLLEWFSLTGQSKTKAVLEYLKVISITFP
jgi:SWI/SNF-related matrix-associated actin-dependent regulator 1 of chromatin subfamily A